jgi:hypothetical protein
VQLVLCAGVLSSCGVPSFNVRQVSDGGGSDPDAASGTGRSEQPTQDDAGRGGDEARAGRGSDAGGGGAAGRRGGGVSGRKAEAGKSGAAAGESGARAGESDGGSGGSTPQSAGAGADGNSAGMPAAAGGSGGSAGGGAAGGGGSPATDDTACRNWRHQDETGSFNDLGPAPGNEMNSQSSVSQWICRAAAPGGSNALGKFVPGFGCYGTYASGNTRVGFGATQETGGFEVLLPNSQCPLAWAAPGSGALDLGGALHACRGRLQNEMYPDGTASGTELGQWIDVGGSLQCWTQFHDANGDRDGGSRRLTENLEVLTRAR